MRSHVVLAERHMCYHVVVLEVPAACFRFRIEASSY
jgi:hypothetical protein